ncbi:MAG TPA: ferrochelatase [Bryobacteraceae bacterium]|nr:ferrochelatase [Bryobacteraceae bacterium]
MPDALLIVSFGGPEQHEDVMPFLENVTRGRGIPQERLLSVAEHYHHFGGRSPINDQNRELIAALREKVNLPIYWGNRNWRPFLTDAMRQMQSDGIGRAAAFITSAFGSWSGCRQYLEDIDQARAACGGGAPQVDALPLFGNHPAFIEAFADRLGESLRKFTRTPHVAFTAHSVPLSMAETSPYVRQLERACAGVAAVTGLTDWKLVYQSRSGPPTQPWLEPDILDHIRERAAEGVRDVIIAPIGFISDHMEVLYDLDTEAAALCDELGITMQRCRTVGTHARFIDLIVSQIGEQRSCEAGCCPRPARPVAR